MKRTQVKVKQLHEGRPTKMNPRLIEIFTQIVNENMLYCTNEDIFHLLNLKLKEEGLEQISYMTFWRWITKAADYQSTKPELADMFTEFCYIIKTALIRERSNLLNNLRAGGDAQWQRFAWILERKFDEWNIRNKQDIEQTTKVIKVFDETEKQ